MRSEEERQRAIYEKSMKVLMETAGKKDVVGMDELAQACMDKVKAESQKDMFKRLAVRTSHRAIPEDPRSLPRPRAPLSAEIDHRIDRHYSPHARFASWQWYATSVAVLTIAVLTVVIVATAFTAKTLVVGEDSTGTENLLTRFR